MATETIPPIDNHIVCIVDKGSVTLAAVISSYLVSPGRYFPLFLFPRVRACLECAVNSEHDDYVPKIVGSRTSVLINNAVSRAGGYKYMVLAGLNEDQKSYMAIPNAEHIIEIAHVSEVREKLSKIGVPVREELACRSSEVLKGLFHAQHTARQLAIDESAPFITPQKRELDGIVITEQTADNAACVVAVNYALSIGANLQIVKPLKEGEFRHIQNFVQKWITTGSYNQMQKVVDKISNRVLCSDSIHQGQFRSLASHSSPIVFNNACWSWYEVGAFLLASGARAYIGTLWRIRNDVAVRGARTFYENLFESTVLNAFHKATQAIKTSKDRNIYMLWGLHFSTVSLPKSHAESRKNVFRELVKSMLTWIRHAKNTPVAEVRRNSVEILELIENEILTNFGKDVEEAGPTVSALFSRPPKP